MYLKQDDPRVAFLDNYRNYTNKPLEMEGKIMNYIGQPYKDFLELQYSKISALFDRAEKEQAEVSDIEGNKVVITQ
jgi:hypothetical protein